MCGSCASRCPPGSGAEMRVIGLDLLQAMAEIALAAGAEVMDVYGAASGVVAKADGSPLTQADLRADRVVCDGLRRLFPGVPIVSEESSPVLVPGAESFLLVDPLDGTREFVARNGQFTVNIALVQGDRAIAGAVFAPALGELFLGSHTAGAWMSERGGALRSIRVAPSVAPAPLRVLGSRSHERPGTRAWLDALSRPWVLQPLGSSIKFCRIAQGHADAYPRFGDTSQWDTAAGQAVLEAAGGAVRTAAGAPLA